MESFDDTWPSISSLDFTLQYYLKQTKLRTGINPFSKLTLGKLSGFGMIKSLFKKGLKTTRLNVELLHELSITMVI